MQNKYLIRTSKPLPGSVLKEDAFLFLSARYMKQMETDRFQRSIAIPLKDKYKIISTDLRQRLHTEIPADEVVAVTDTDEHFYKLVDGRRLRSKVPVYKSLKQFLGSHLRVRQQTSYNRDCAMNIGTNMKQELECYNVSLVRCAEQAKFFEQFISDDYAKSMALLKKWEDLQKKLSQQNIEMQHLVNCMFTIKSKIVGYDFKFKVQQKYGRFLYYLSPPSWRVQHRDFARSTEIENMGFDLGAEDGDDPFSIVFERLKKQCSITKVTPVLYFTEPHHVIDVFEGIEKQQLNHFAHVTHVTPYTRKLNEDCKTLRENIEKDSFGLKTDITELQSHVTFLEEKAKYLERKFHKIIYGHFYDCVGSPEVLRLLVNLQFCHERINGDCPMNLDLYSLANFLEQFFMFYMQQLEYTPNDTVKEALDQSIAAERKKWKDAHHATRELLAFATMKRALVRATSPRFVKPPIPQRCNKIVQSEKSKTIKTKKIETKRKKSSVVTLAEAEKDYLMYFTEWNETEDPAKYLHLAGVTV